LCRCNICMGHGGLSFLVNVMHIGDGGCHLCRFRASKTRLVSAHHALLFTLSLQSSGTYRYEVSVSV
jgi:hypothetical protein